MILLVDSEGSDQTALTWWLIWVFAVGICPETHINMPRHKLFQDSRSERPLLTYTWTFLLSLLKKKSAYNDLITMRIMSTLYLLVHINKVAGNT